MQELKNKKTEKQDNHIGENCLFFRTWAARRKHTKMRKQRHNEFSMCPVSLGDVEQERSPENDDQSQGIGRPTLPNGTNLITVLESLYISIEFIEIRNFDKNQIYELSKSFIDFSNILRFFSLVYRLCGPIEYLNMTKTFICILYSRYILVMLPI